MRRSRSPTPCADSAQPSSATSATAPPPCTGCSKRHRHRPPTAPWPNFYKARQAGDPAEHNGFSPATKSPNTNGSENSPPASAPRWPPTSHNPATPQSRPSHAAGPTTARSDTAPQESRRTRTAAGQAECDVRDSHKPSRPGCRIVAGGLRASHFRFSSWRNRRSHLDRVRRRRICWPVIRDCRSVTVARARGGSW